MSQQEPGPSPLIGKSPLYRKTTFCFPPSICWWISGLFPPCGSSRWCCLNMSVHVFASVFRPLGETPVSGVAHHCHLPAVLQTGLHVVVGWSFFFFSETLFSFTYMNLLCIKGTHVHGQHVDNYRKQWVSVCVIQENVIDTYGFS